MNNNKVLAVVGSRSFSDRDKFNSIMSEFITTQGHPKSIVSGGAIGTDTLAHEWANNNGVEVLVIDPEYNKFPKKDRNWMAPKARNAAIVEKADVVLAIWDMESTGTKDTIDKSVDKGITVYLYDITSCTLQVYQSSAAS